MERRSFIKFMGATGAVGVLGASVASNANADVAFNGIAGYAGNYCFNGWVNGKYRSDYFASVQHIQWKLGIKADGAFGSGTRAAVINFQKTHGLTADGVVGQATARKMGMGWSSSPIIKA